jgi:GH15 family glucan-1,4-alpha-glucosidase
MDRYPNIGDHGLIGDLQTAALVTTDGTLDWFCCPRFDSPSVFGSLLDADRGGHYRIAPDRDDYVSRQLYLPDTAILITRFMTPDGVGEVHDFMPVIEGAATGRHRLVRNIRVVRGVMRFKIELQPRFDYGRAPHTLEISEHGAVFRSGGLELTVHGIAPEGSSAQDLGITVQRDGDGLRWTRTLREGQSGGVVLESAGGASQTVTPEQAQQLQEDTARFWRGWLHRSSYTGRWREMVNRSAITLKLLTYAPTGAPVAAPTTGLPEQAGGERNWDYRYTWIRDGSFSIYALLGLGYVEEAAAFGAWLRDRAEEQAGDASGPLKIMYRVDGTSDLVEESLEHWEGWRGSRPVRIGNGAADQLQLDIYGEAMDAVFLGDSYGIQPAYQGWKDLAHIVDWLCEHWDQPDEGIWETRGGQRNFTYGRFQAWIALDDRTRRDLQPDHGPRLEPQGRRVHPALRHRGAGLLAAADAAAGVHRPARPDVDLDPGRDGP